MSGFAQAMRWSIYCVLLVALTWLLTGCDRDSNTIESSNAESMEPWTPLPAPTAGPAPRPYPTQARVIRALPAPTAASIATTASALPTPTVAPIPTTASALPTPTAAPIPTTTPSAQPSGIVCANGIAVPDPEDNPGLVADCEVLLAIRDILVGDSSLNWSGETDIRDWDGIGLRHVNLQERVVTLALNGYGLTGSVPAQLRDLSNLEVLDLSYNGLPGRIPPELGDLSNLVVLDLQYNRLTGTIPARLGNLSSLKTLTLNRNRLTGGIPQELAGLSNLGTLGLDDNKLTGCIPDSLYGMSAYLTGPPPCGDETKPIVFDTSRFASANAQAAARIFQLASPQSEISFIDSGGFDAFIGGEAMFTTQPRPMTADEAAAARRNGVEFIMLPLWLQSLAVFAGEANDFVDCLTVEQLRSLWRPDSSIRTWSDLDPGWPDEAINLYGPTHGSPEHIFFTTVIMGERGLSRDDYSVMDTTAWVRALANDRYALSYYDYHGEDGHGYHGRPISISDGTRCVAPSEDSIMSGAYTPLSGSLLTYVNTEALKSPAGLAFAAFYITNMVGASRELMSPLTQISEKQHNTNIDKLSIFVSDNLPPDRRREVLLRGLDSVVAATASSQSFLPGLYEPLGKTIESSDGKILIDVVDPVDDATLQTYIDVVTEVYGSVAQLYGDAPDDQYILFVAHGLADMRPSETVKFWILSRHKPFLRHETAHWFTHRLAPTDELWLNEGISRVAQFIGGIDIEEASLLTEWVRNRKGLQE